MPLVIKLLHLILDTGFLILDNNIVIPNLFRNFNLFNQTNEKNQRN